MPLTSCVGARHSDILISDCTPEIDTLGIVGGVIQWDVPFVSSGVQPFALNQGGRRNAAYSRRSRWNITITIITIIIIISSSSTTTIIVSIMIVTITITINTVLRLFHAACRKTIVFLFPFVVGEPKQASLGKPKLCLLVWLRGVVWSAWNALHGALEAGGHWLQGAYPSRHLEWTYP